MGREARLNVAATGGGVNLNGKRTQLQNWLLEAGWQIGDATREANTQEVAWAISAVRNGQPLVIVQPAKQPDIIVVEAGMDFAPDFIEQFTKLDEAERRNVIESAKVAVLQAGNDFGGFAEPLQHIAFSRFLYDDAMSKQAFFEMLQRVLHARFIAISMLMRKTGQQPNDAWSESLDIH